MGLESRRNGRLYFYQKQRHGTRVVSVYVGAGETAQLIARLADMDRERKAETIRRERFEREQLDALHRHEAEREREIRRIVAATLRGAGFHTHKGQWRERHNARRNDYT